MNCEQDRYQELLIENRELRSRLRETEETLELIRKGEVDAIVISGPMGDQVYALSGADQVYRVLFDTINEGAAVLDPEGTILFCNRALSEILRTPSGKLLGGSFSFFVTEEDISSFQTLLNIGVTENLKRHFTLKLKDGSLMKAKISTAPLEIEHGTTICMILSDMTDDRQLESAVNREELLRAVFETSQDSIFVKDLSRAFIRLNPASSNFFGRPSHELIGRKQEEFAQTTEEIKHICETDKRVLSGQRIEEQRSILIGGATSIWNILQVPLRDAADDIIGLCGIARNMTDWRKPSQWRISPVDRIPYVSEAMKAIIRLAEMAAARNTTVLLLGESGSGKDFLAEHIHKSSDRPDGPFFSVNCAAISPELAESELFGHEKGAFTGATARKKGLFELAEGGTLLLNEIGDLSLALQSKLLTFLDTKKFTRVGGEKEIPVDVRLIAATNKDLEKEVKEGKFREDLYYRLNVIAIRVPPLRERKNDLPILVRQILLKIVNELQIHGIPMVTGKVLNTLEKYHWPGNVRELRNRLERAVILCEGHAITLADLGLENYDKNSYSTDEKASFTISFPVERSFHEITQDVKRFLIREALRLSGNSRQDAAKLLEISRFSLRRHMKILCYEETDQQDHEERTASGLNAIDNKRMGDEQSALL